jgi:arylsulfatase A-like enzyme
VDFLGTHDLLDDTLVVVLSDNGRTAHAQHLSGRVGLKPATPLCGITRCTPMEVASALRWSCTGRRGLPTPG